jgi:hypothetical protein
MSVVLGFQHAMRMLHIVNWSVRLYYIFKHDLINGTISENKASAQNVCFDFSTTRLKNLVLKQLREI